MDEIAGGFRSGSAAGRGRRTRSAGRGCVRKGLPARQSGGEEGSRSRDGVDLEETAGRGLV